MRRFAVLGSPAKRANPFRSGLSLEQPDDRRMRVGSDHGSPGQASRAARPTRHSDLMAVPECRTVMDSLAGPAAEIAPAAQEAIDEDY